MKLVIVESPTKAKTIEKYLGKKYKVIASQGHIRDLPESTLGIDVKGDFSPKYVISQSKKDIVKTLKAQTAKAEEVLLATDPDREGEAISWHLAQALKLPTNIKNRIVFNEITEKAVKQALTEPREIDQNLVDAQQARRALDRLVGYKLSPLLCKKISGKLSAGRVQSVALKFVVDREKEINAFNKEEYHVITAMLKEKADAKKDFKAVLAKKDGKKITVKTTEEANEIKKAVEKADFICGNIKRAQSKSYAPPPFTTSSMQQEASNKLGMSSDITMRVAQQLYEGINVEGEGHIALVTYIRSDSVRIAEDALFEVRNAITKMFGESFLPEKPNYFKNKKNAQDAHEAIRPVSVSRTPKSLEGKLDRNQMRLYRLIYERFISSQMTPAVYDTLTGEINAENYGFKFSGKILVFEGYLKAQGKQKVEEKEDEDGENAYLPNLESGQKTYLSTLSSEQKFTKPPARYTDATLIRLLEDKGIGRPSTYASILTVLLKRQYTYKEKKYIVPTEVAVLVTEFLEKHFVDIMDPKFTAEVEEKLDEVEQDGKDWKEIVKDFYNPMMEIIQAVQTERIETGETCPKCGMMLLEKTSKYGKYIQCENKECGYKKQPKENISDVICEKCGANLIIRTGRYGKFLACPNYPECKNIKSLDHEETKTDEKCEKCGSDMMVKKGRYGNFLACTNEECKAIKSMAKPVAKCPFCGKDVTQRRSKTGKIFYGCSGYPDCNFISWDIPTGDKCPTCGTFTVIKETKAGKFIRCTNKGCDFEKEITQTEE
ncbi:MAG: type I DNA topoisomerase [Bacillota bacterium]